MTSVIFFSHLKWEMFKNVFNVWCCLMWMFAGSHETWHACVLIFNVYGFCEAAGHPLCTSGGLIHFCWITVCYTKWAGNGWHWMVFLETLMGTLVLMLFTYISLHLFFLLQSRIDFKWLPSGLAWVSCASCNEAARLIQVSIWGILVR